MIETKQRKTLITRRTRETEIELELFLDGSGLSSIATGVGFMDHMLELFAVHGFFDLRLQASGDTHVDDHHITEDLGICLGKAFSSILGNKAGISRYGQAYVPMDETLARVCLDFSGRPYLHYGVMLTDQKVGTFDTALVKEFMRAFALHGSITLHIDLLHGENSHHIIEAVFKALGRAVAQAVVLDPRLKGQLSSKGMLEE